MPGAPPTVRVATWNIRAAIGPGEPFPAAWWRHVTRERFERIAATIVDIDADIVGLQEVAVMTPDGALFDQPLELARLTDRSVRYAAAHTFELVEPESGRSIGISTWGNALLTRDPVVDGFALRLPAGGDTDLVEPVGSALPLAGVTFLDAPYGTREPRCLVGGDVAWNGTALRVIDTHLTFAGTEQRRTQAEALARIALDADGPVIVIGDLNAPIEAPALAALATGLDDAFAAIGIVPGDQRRASSGPNAIDHVLSRGLQVRSIRVHEAAGDASDHLPVVAELALPDGEG